MSNILAQMGPIHERLKAERLRLGFSQSELATVGGVKRRAQFNYEQGERTPDAIYLARVAAVGIDILFVATGRKEKSGDEPCQVNEELLRSCMTAIDIEALKRSSGYLDADRMARASAIVYNRCVIRGANDDEALAVVRKEAQNVVEVLVGRRSKSAEAITTGNATIDRMIEDRVGADVLNIEIFLKEALTTPAGRLIKDDLGDPREWPARERSKLLLELLSRKLLTFDRARPGRLTVVDEARCASWLLDSTNRILGGLSSSELKRTQPATAVAASRRRKSGR